MKLTNVNELASLVIIYKNIPTYIDKNECLSFVCYQNTVLLLRPRGKHLHTRWSKIALAEIKGSMDAIPSISQPFLCSFFELTNGYHVWSLGERNSSSKYLPNLHWAQRYSKS